ncbi:peptide-methionine (S)-S-oxide reductase MsrA [Aestuariimicrobium kwangyangense]|uniref:peptide-methionine (S)-S-oxide reductase MsrA n=1 Tax=Aestuariimicrobium kwangyangense TaxID=396389 RepID=UPI0003B34146|nr:peptide-methionine (S)-S-oxide reductase MsrA [Aestuariimicrobium kwangyangense]
MFGFNQAPVTAETALPGRAEPVLTQAPFHRIFGDKLDRDFPGAQTAYLALGCFWGAEKLYWQTEGVLSTAVGYQGGFTPNPTYREVCSGRTGHAEVVRVTFDPTVVSFADLLGIFFENHDPTQGDRQGNDVGSQYRSAIYTVDDEQAAVAERVRDEYQQAFSRAGFSRITTEIAPAGEFYLAEDYHQQYLEANPNGYCPVHATGVTCRAS